MDAQKTARGTVHSNEPVSTHADDAEAALHRIKTLARNDASFAAALRQCHSTQDAARLVDSHGIKIMPEVLWRHRGNLIEGGAPTWPG